MIFFDCMFSSPRKLRSAHGLYSESSPIPALLAGKGCESGSVAPAPQQKALRHLWQREDSLSAALTPANTHHTGMQSGASITWSPQIQVHLRFQQPWVQLVPQPETEPLKAILTFMNESPPLKFIIHLP